MENKSVPFYLLAFLSEGLSMKKLQIFCKVHWNPLGVMLLGGILAIGIILPILNHGETIEFLDRWQGIIGAAISTVAAFALFQIQRKLDRGDAYKSRQRMANSIYLSLGTLSDNFLAQSNTFTTLTNFLGKTVEIKETKMISDFKKISTDARMLEGYCQRRSTEISNIPRDEFLREETSERLQALQNNLEAAMESCHRLLHIFDPLHPNQSSFLELVEGWENIIKRTKEIKESAHRYLNQ